MATLAQGSSPLPALAVGKLLGLALGQGAVVAFIVFARLPASTNPAGRSLVTPHLTGHHGPTAFAGPPPISANTAPYLVGTTTLAAHVAFALLLAGAALLRSLLRHRGWAYDSTSVRLVFAGVAAAVAVVTTPVVISISLGRDDSWVVDAAEVGRYAFLMALVLTVLLGPPWRRAGSRPSDEKGSNQCSTGAT
ncbi:hypothetical protein [Kibdelosporangium phytohabitans]|uniref:Uncharacterized protein n=1 Tax=Kibdelosporangium phytohabitans TaxID=860235 RepID=A0A0N9HYX0_9PSEU|nr:hypothetical protein [Kibdelosporangium phytohabitans]ALG08506.1 hypothetical protein AOZ06_17705 [Kibdelosporangium phytohabitans]MBE1470427.1 hypothetical protein [Kibdelosporangium phytohabitans]